MENYNKYLVSGGEYSLFKVTQRAEELQKKGIKVFNLTLGDPTIETFQPLVLRTIEELKKSKISQYPSAIGCLEYRKAVANWAKRHHFLDLDPESEIISANGTKEAIFNFTLAFDWSGNQVIIQPSLSYPVYASSAHLHGVELVSLPLNRSNRFLPDLEAIPLEILKRCQFFWINSPHNPTTTIMSASYAKQLLELAEKYQFLIASDECYNDLYFGDQKPISFLDFPNSDRWVVFRSLSKRSHVTGYRIGALLSRNKQLMKMLKKLRPPMGVGIPTFIQMGALESWNEDTHFQISRTLYQKKRDLLVSALEAKGFQIFGAEATFYLWFSHPKLKTSEEIVDTFIKASILITPGGAFGNDGEGFARLAYCVPDNICSELVTCISGIKI